MALIVKRGQVPKTPHTEFYAEEGLLSMEEIHGSYGFSGAWSRKMHVRRYPTVQAQPPRPAGVNLKPAAPGELPLQPFHILTGKLPFGGDFVRARKPLFYGATTTISVSKPSKSMGDDEFFRNGEGYECVFVQDGKGVLATEYGELPFHPLQYLLIPKGTTCQWRLKTPNAWFFIIESVYPIHFAPHHLNAQGQATFDGPGRRDEIGVPT
jgi:homogentisate 1,2-dioxygenase